MTSSVPYKYCVKLIKKLKCCIAWFIWTGIPTQNVEFWTEKKPDFFIPLRMLLGTCNDNYGLVASHLFLGFLLSVDPKYKLEYLSYDLSFWKIMTYNFIFTVKICASMDPTILKSEKNPLKNSCYFNFIINVKYHHFFIM